MTESGTLLSRVTGILREAGLRVYTEFERSTLPLPESACFVTVGIAQMNAQQSIAHTAVPVSLLLRVRIHVKAGEDAAVMHDAVQRVLAAMLPLSDPYSAAEGTAPVWQKQLDRLVTELGFRLDGLLTEEEGGD